MKIKLPICLLLLISLPMLTSCLSTRNINQFMQQETQNLYTCNYRGQNREFCLFLPDSQDLSSTPLIIMLHGYGSSAQSFSIQTELEKSALPRNYGVLYISGIKNPSVRTSSPGWNFYYDSNGKADINFIVDLTRYIQKKYNTSKDCYAVGFSNGAFMASKLAVEHSELYKAVASAGGMMPAPVWNHKKKAYNQPSRFFQINGTKDEVTPMRLNDSAKYNPNPAMEDVIDYFAGVNHVKTAPVKNQLNEIAEITMYENKVWWLLLEDYPHCWPSQAISKLNINEMILDFFDREN